MYISIPTRPFFSSESPPLIRPPHRPPYIPAPHESPNHEHLEEKPLPASGLLLPVELPSPPSPFSCVSSRGTPGLFRVHLVDVLVLRLDGNNIVVIGQFARFRGKAEVGDGGEGEGARFEAFGPLVLGCVLEGDGEGFFGEVGEPDFRGGGGGADAASLGIVSVSCVECWWVHGRRGRTDCTYRTTADLVLLPIVVLVVRDRCVPQHSHHIREDDARPLVFVRVDEDTEAFEIVDGAEDGAGLGSLLGEPDCHAIAVQVALAVDFEFDFNLGGVMS